MGSVIVQPRGVLTPYGPFMNFLGAVAVIASASISISIPLSLIVGNIFPVDQIVLCRSHCTFQF